ncbi:hypothetical protein FA15DRAFT_585177 [Coprinopsis marcescibilis]|uniref:SGF29 C-terminal domain-containing protein n=1 Tax=Coprinopsis marcescibilis TaxID=230819 RepID=A0A5C3L5J4_COPMA|nr:hypothetical protein FA15DRAFT_585177 [Coprinopsis marcescibilis]
MERRRGMPTRPSSEEVEYWTRSADSLRQLSKQFSSHPSLDLVGRANRLISTWPTDGDLPGEGLRSLKENYKKLINSLDDIQKHSETEVKMIDQSIEQLDVLVAMRKAPEPPLLEKRNKRPRASSPPATPVSTPQSSSRGVSITLPPRTGASGPGAQQKKQVGRVHPLQGGRKVALWNSQVNPNSEEDWILAILLRRYEVRDAEEQDAALSVIAGQKYVIPLPDPKGPLGPEFPVGSTVLGLYPDTSCFYRAEIVATPKQMQALGVSIFGKYLQAKQPTYKLKFEDDDNQEHPVSAEWVVEYPGT